MSLNTESLLVEAVAKLPPSAVRARRDKQGFGFPFGTWLQGSLRHHCEGWHDGLVGDLLRADGLGASQMWQAGRLHWSCAWVLAAFTGWWVALRV